MQAELLFAILWIALVVSVAIIGWRRDMGGIAYTATILLLLLLGVPAMGLAAAIATVVGDYAAAIIVPLVGSLLTLGAFRLKDALPSRNDGSGGSEPVKCPNCGFFKWTRKSAVSAVGRIVALLGLVAAVAVVVLGFWGLQQLSGPVAADISHDRLVESQASWNSLLFGGLGVSGALVLAGGLVYAVGKSGASLECENCGYVRPRTGTSHRG